MTRCLPTKRRETEGAGLVLGGWGVGCWTRSACRTSPLLSWGSAHPTKSLQHSLALAGGAWPKILAATSSSQSYSWSQTRTGRERPDPAWYPHQWITNKLSQSNNPHPHWWREITASRKLNVGAHVIQEEYDKYSAQHYALWQVAAFRLP